MLDAGLSQSDLSGALRGAGFTRWARLSWQPLEAPTAPPTAGEIITEQVSWAQARALGEVLAAVYGLPPYGAAAAQTAARALQQGADLEAFVAYRDRPVGAMVTLSAAGMLCAPILEAASDEARAALTARLAFEADARGLRAYLFTYLFNRVRCDRVNREALAASGLEVWCLRS
ncbi:hypothetical protein [Truepera radiovictrix]|uniref:Uncharacterized protein n=1 Tax=Truepera radiovictrix (strain DSM 17093 / CIP 108686 / LMG 22925 / RQ-24) TaxID=649638 RepID=D7CWK5_TRURR|nr:hypothetical protein [Truepera radiovictrix]ADI14404.1 hypothetical protein Trad_1281 [Truepera radiovictrix DSM 17093]WMT57039.1 hypothetical protein RCV51_13600 [Truepera radiovictrix]